jgi:hypothetical protein
MISNPATGNHLGVGWIEDIALLERRTFLPHQEGDMPSAAGRQKGTLIT